MAVTEEESASSSSLSCDTKSKHSYYLAKTVLRSSVVLQVVRGHIRSPSSNDVVFGKVRSHFPFCQFSCCYCSTCFGFPFSPFCTNGFLVCVIFAEPLPARVFRIHSNQQYFRSSILWLLKVSIYALNFFVIWIRLCSSRGEP